MKSATYGGSGEARPDAKMSSERHAGVTTPINSAIKRKANAKRRRRDKEAGREDR